MFKSYKYNQKFKKRAKKSIYDQEQNLIHDFLASKNENIEFEYTCSKEAVNAAAALKNYTTACRQPLNVMQRANFVYVVKTFTEGDENNGKSES